MLKIAHRINTVEQLQNVPSSYGIELDIRAYKDQLILHHDPFQNGELFEDLLREYKHQFIILNTKCEGMEEAILDLLKKYQITDYFFLDLSLPFLVKYMRKGEKKIAIRYSEYEPIAIANAFAGKVDWVWIDCFNDMPLTKEDYSILKKNFKLCLVSPELQGHSLDRIEEFKKRLEGMPVDAVCTKKPELW